MDDVAAETGVRDARRLPRALILVLGQSFERDPSPGIVDPVPSAPQSRPGRYAEFDAGQLADAVELAFEREEIPDWELVFELSRRAMSAESVQTAVGVAKTA
jgi:hypothetical protein